VDGILNINKPVGMTSFDVVARVKRLTRERHAGHAGTLDPDASGVLPVCLGQATRVIDYLFAGSKRYLAQLELGVATDSFDSAGRITATKDASAVTREEIESALARFRGPIWQIPPMFSAVKYHGQPLYRLARAGIEVERKSRQIHIYSLSITSSQPPHVELDVVCGKGTYIRSLVSDLGEALGTGAVLRRLTRLKVGPFNIEDAVSISHLEQIATNEDWHEYLYPLDFVLLDLPALLVNKEQQCSLHHGAPIRIESDTTSASTLPADGALHRVYADDGDFLAIVKYDAQNCRYQPEKVFIRKCCEPRKEAPGACDRDP
jgi:tRNA pseudouridine55 synthase